MQGGQMVLVLLYDSRVHPDPPLPAAGDSRAVLCRAGQAIPLTQDHKPARQDERERVERCGGQIVDHRGLRVQGVLAMTRALGDHALRPYVIADPEVTRVARCQGDQLLLLASDGLWDVMGCQVAVTLALRCLQSAYARGATRFAAARIAAKVLVRAALDKGTRDNITVVVVDLAPEDPEVPRGS
jgi:protein phosphatase 2C